MRIALLPIAATAAFLAGCANHVPPGTVHLTVLSQPAGAYVVDKKVGKGGVAPQTYSYPTAQFAKDQAGCIHVFGFDARWGSGAAATSAPTIRLCPSEGNQFTVTVARNPADPGLDRDLDFALRLDQAQAAKDNARIEGLAAGFIGAMEVRNAQQQRMAPIRCTSRNTFGRIETDCN